ncbi:ABC transporter substrate-binding protein [Iodobacter sp. HSC-16F04]|uniref:ABC transporter substrate-binding protein n=1 Tax=Iodobacter violaceini TaxID=3044271 RepID=A0ABX0L2F3_9NEIS|nr:ABC transporter substrate-binding protein [Iodobacter violacea]NHQ86733.1 ABC transporter substrate-binding protein [Iodobacter violacea]
MKQFKGKTIRLLAVICGILLSPLTLAATLTDLAGRTVVLPARAERIILGEGRMLASLAILDRELPAKRVVGMLGDFEQLDPGSYEQYRKVYPKLDQITRLGRSSQSFSVEEAIGLKPQLAIFSLRGHGPDASDQATLQRLSKAGITVIYVDFTKDPLRNTEASIRVLGQALGKVKAAEEYIAFYREEMAKVSQGLAGVSHKPKVFLESRVGLSNGCCETITHGMLGRFVDAAGGDNIANALVPGSHGTVSVEYLLQSQPEVYIGTGIGNPLTARQSGSPRIALGAGIDEATAKASLQRSLGRTGIAQLTAVRQGRAYAISHQFNYSAANVAAVQAMAKWLYPARFEQLNPQATLQNFYKRFQPVPLQGTFWVEAD